MAKQQTASSAELAPVSPDVRRLDDREGFRWEERINFRNDTGYDETMLRDRAYGSVQRALARERLRHLPTFDSGNELRIVVEIVAR